MNINVGDYVVYLKDQKFEDWINLKKSNPATKKGIWSVSSIRDNEVDLVGIASHNKFTTRIECITNIKLFPAYIDKNHYFTQASLNKYYGTDDHYFKGINPCAEILLESKSKTNWGTTLNEWNTFNPKNFGVSDVSYAVTNSAMQFENTTKRSSIKMKINNVIDSNVKSAKTGATVAMGKALNRVVKERLAPQLPFMVRGYADHVLADVVIANVAQFVVDNFVSNPKAKVAANAMMDAAMIDFMASFNLDQIVSDVLDSANFDLPSTL